MKKKLQTLSHHPFFEDVIAWFLTVVTAVVGIILSPRISWGIAYTLIIPLIIQVLNIFVLRNRRSVTTVQYFLMMIMLIGYYWTLALFEDFSGLFYYPTSWVAHAVSLVLLFLMIKKNRRLYTELPQKTWKEADVILPEDQPTPAPEVNKSIKFRKFLFSHREDLIMWFLTLLVTPVLFYVHLTSYFFLPLIGIAVILQVLNIFVFHNRRSLFNVSAVFIVIFFIWTAFVNYATGTFGTSYSVLGSILNIPIIGTIILLFVKNLRLYRELPVNKIVAVNQTPAA
jgi:hypothetical protein